MPWRGRYRHPWRSPHRKACASRRPPPGAAAPRAGPPSDRRPADRLRAWFVAGISPWRFSLSCARIWPCLAPFLALNLTINVALYVGESKVSKGRNSLTPLADLHDKPAGDALQVQGRQAEDRIWRTGRCPDHVILVEVGIDEYAHRPGMA